MSVRSSSSSFKKVTQKQKQKITKKKTSLDFSKDKVVQVTADKNHLKNNFVAIKSTNSIFKKFINKNIKLGIEAITNIAERDESIQNYHWKFS